MGVPVYDPSVTGYRRDGSAAATSMETIDATDAAWAKAQELGVDLTKVKGTGKDGRITVDDVEAAA